MNLRYILLISISAFFFSNNMLAQSDPHWDQEKHVALEREANPQLSIREANIYTLDLEALKTNLAKAPLRGDAEQGIRMSFPNEAGEFVNYEVFEAPVFSDGLQKKYPDIRSYIGIAEGQGSSIIRFGYSAAGFHGMILSGNETEYIDKINGSIIERYIVTKKSQWKRDHKNPFSCLVDEGNISTTNTDISKLQGDCRLRTFRLALACTGEYSTYHGGTVELVLAEMAVAMTRVNGVYERDLSVTMIMVDNNEDLIFLDGNTDPYTNDNGGTMLNQNQNTIDDIIGTDNYDIGHVFSTGGGGIAQLNAPCGNGKARGVTGLPAPINDPFYVDYVCHEMGHQFGANHTQNNQCNSVTGNSVEVGSANTIMGYAGICPPNSKMNSDDHFHAVSLAEIANFLINGNGSTCGENMEAANQAPTISVEKNSYILPVTTPFYLEAEGEDLDDDPMSFNWEQMDPEAANMPPSPLNIGGPSFISNSSLDVPIRYMPNLDAVINNVDEEWEVLPSVSRDMNFRCTVRDNNELGGCTAEADIALTFTEDAGPFLVQEPNTAVIWEGGNTEIVEWDVAGTDLAPVSCAKVDILLSTDGGFTYPITLQTEVDNNGTSNVNAPSLVTTTARVMVVCSDNIFYDISDENFEIVSEFSTTLTGDDQTVCPGESITANLTVTGINEEQDVTLSAITPPGFETDFSVEMGTTPLSSVITVNTMSTIAPGEYTIEIVITSESKITSEFITINVLYNTIAEITGIQPENGTYGVLSNMATLQWDEIPHAEYSVELATDYKFENIIFSDITNANEISLNMLDEATVYYWRVKQESICIASEYSEIFAFQTEVGNCISITSTEVTEIIEDEDGPFLNTIMIDNNIEFDYMSVYVEMEHEWIGDIHTTLASPAGDEYSLFDRPGVPDSEFGCDENDIEVLLFNNAEDTAMDLENTCDDAGSPSIQGEFQPIELLPLNGYNTMGQWTLIVGDEWPQDDAGILNSWAINLCTNADGSEIELTNNTLFVMKSDNGLIDDSKLAVELTDPDGSEFLVLSSPKSGTLMRFDFELGQYVALQVGDTFNQFDIDNSFILYTHEGDDEEFDSFKFNVLDSQDNWLVDQVFNIIIIQNGIAGEVVLNESITCFGTNTGSIELNTIGGTPPFEFSIDGENFFADSIFTDLAAGNYTGYLKDAVGNTFTTATYNLTQPDMLVVTSSVNLNVVTLSGSGGTMPYAYSMDGVNYSTNDVFTVMTEGDLTFFIQDDNGCISEVSVFVDVPDLGIDFDFVKSVVCFGDMDGEFFVNGISGIPGYEYKLDDGLFEADNHFLNLSPGDYDVTVRDEFGQEVTQTVSIVELDEIVITVLDNINKLELSVTGGLPPYMYSIDGQTFQGDSVFTITEEGVYEVFVIDDSGCEGYLEDISVEIVGLDDEFLGNMEIFPNPSKGMFTLKCVNCQYLPNQVEIYNTLGQLLEIKDWGHTENLEIDLSLYASGQYYLMATSQKGNVQKKIIKI